uniref:PPM-type phosphatase domain-containing protein n=1 Tax=Meloidogyne incognita TaxID=6306 RepID=A0A914LYS8_MELIC
MSSFFRRHVRGLLRTTFSAPQSTETISSIATNNADDDFDNHDESEEERLLLSLDHRLGPAGTSSENNFQTRNGKKRQSAPEVYSGKTGLDLPNIHIGPLSLPVKACHTGPEGGLTCVQPMRQRTIAKMAKLDDEEFSLSSMDEEVDEREEEEEVEVREEEEDEAREEEKEEVKERDKEREEEKEEEDEEENKGKEVGEEVKEGRGENEGERFEEENEEENKGTEVKNEVIEEMNRFRPVDEDQEDLSGRYQQQTQLIKPTKETKFLEVPKKENKKIKKTTRKSRGGGKALIQSADSIEALGLVGVDDFSPFRNGSALEQLDWSSWDEHRALGLSTSLYERHPVSGLPAGHPIADVFGIIARENNAILALADGVNWGDGARLAARCAIRGAIDHLNNAIERQQLNTTNEIFHSMLGAFHAAHALILQEGGALTTLCVAFVAPVKDSDSSVLCVCNVGDSLCFVYNQTHGVNEITLGSHNIAQMRDMRDAGGALGPVDGRNPQLHNLTCSMTFVEKGDLVFITSDGISDNFDPVVGKFCSIKKPRDEAEEEVTETITSEKENNLTTNQQQQRNK